MPLSDPDLRTQILAETQGRRLDEAYLHPDIRADLEAEASKPDRDALVTREMLDQLEEYMDENEAAGIPAGVLTAQESTTSRALVSTDAVVVVPGFLASSLSDTRRGGLGLIWVSRHLYTRNLFGGLRLGRLPESGDEADLNPDVRIVSAGGLPVVYDVLKLALEARRYYTTSFGVDWRRDLETAARGLRDRIKELDAQKYPVHLVAHSQGAMVARRALQLLRDDIGAAGADRVVKNLVLLGPANAGSFSAPLAVSGDHESIPTLRKLTHEPTGGFRDVFATMSGIYQLFPWDPDRLPSLADPRHAIGTAAFWKDKAPVDGARLARFYGWAKNIDTAFFNDRTTVILGDYDGRYGEKTTAAVEFAPGGRLVPAHKLPGDGTVPHCNAVLPGVRTVMAPNTDHMLLPTYRNVIESVRLVLKGQDPVARGVAVPKPSDPKAAEYHS